MKSKNGPHKVARRAPVRAAWMAALMASAAGTGALLSAPALAQQASPEARTFDIPAQPLPDALILFGRQAGIEVSAESANTRGRNSRGVSGRMPPSQALSELLSGTGLTFRWTSGESVMIEPAPQASGDGAIQLGPVRVEGKDGSGVGTFASATSDPTATEGSQSYAAPIVALGKENARLVDIPQSISVLTRKQIEDQNIITLPDALRLLNGVTVTDSASYNSFVYSRGFAITQFQTDGGATQEIPENVYARGLEDLSQYDHVELLRGSDALFSGSGDPSGTVNLVRKRPLPDFAVAFEAAAGRWNDFRGTLDLSVPLTSDGKLGTRLVASYRDRDRFFQPSGEKRLNLYGVVEYKPTSDTSLRFGGSYERLKNVGAGAGLPRYNTGEEITEFSRTTAPGAAWSRANFEIYEAFAGLDLSLADNWAIKANSSYIYQNNNDDGYTFPNRAVNPYNRILYFSRVLRYSPYRREVFSSDISVNGEFDALGRRHKVIFGADYRYSKAKYVALWDSVGPTYSISLDNLDNLNIPKPADSSFASFYDFFPTEKQIGVFGKINISISDSINLIGGGRFSRYLQTVNERDWLGDTDIYIRNRPQNVFTPYDGIVIHLAKGWNAYFSYADIYQNQSSRLDMDRHPLSPVRGKTFELGAKREFLNGALLASIALYHTTKNGLAVSVASEDTIDGGLCCYANSGKQVSKGIDIELAGEILTGWQVQIGYTYNENENKRGNNVGAYVNTYTPRHLLKLATDYRFGGALQGWSLGGNAHIQSKNFASGSIYQRRPDGTIETTLTPYDFTQPGYVVVGIHVGYKINDNLSVQGNISNLFDKTYYSTIGAVNRGNYFGEPRSFMFTLRGKF